MLFGRHKVEANTGGESFADGFLDGYHSIRPDEDPVKIPFRRIPIGSTPYHAGYRSGREHAVMDRDTDLGDD